MSAAGLAYERYRTTRHDEWTMRIGARDGAPILFVPPLFEEMNRTRALIAATMRRLADGGHGCWLPDLGGTGESERALAEVAWEDWRHDVAAATSHVGDAAGAAPLIVTLRGGALVDDAAAGACGWWRLAPVSGASLARDMVRAGLSGVEWGGYAPSLGLKASLEAAAPAPVTPLRSAALATAAGAADVKLPGPALWRRSEPGNSAQLANAMAADIAEWRRVCAG